MRLTPEETVDQSPPMARTMTADICPPAAGVVLLGADGEPF
jgi:hypothetical protein